MQSKFSTASQASQSPDSPIIEMAVEKKYFGGEKKVKEGEESLFGKIDLEAMFGTKFGTDDVIRGSADISEYNPRYYYRNNFYQPSEQQNIELNNASQIYFTLAGRYNFIAKNENLRVIFGIGAEGAMRYSSPESSYLSFALYESQCGLNSRLSVLYLVDHYECAIGAYAQLSTGMANTYLKFHGSNITSKFEESTIYGELYNDEQCKSPINGGKGIIQAKNIGPSYNSPISKGKISPYWSYAVGLQTRFSSGLTVSLGVLSLHLNGDLPINSSIFTFRQSTKQVEFDQNSQYYGVSPQGYCLPVNSAQVVQRGQLFNVDTTEKIIGIKNLNFQSKEHTMIVLGMGYSF
ncbi:hypothetical protein [Candidatus Fokinia crypta]|nr:hypothetical protein [Candidatus Fokinia cryptica]